MGQLFSSQRILREFNTLSNNGVVFDLDLSMRSDLGVRRDSARVVVLTNDEVMERQRWKDNKKQIQKGIRTSLLLDNWRLQWSNKAEDLLQLQVAAPMLDPNPSQVSNRSAIAEQRADPRYPPRLHQWVDFPRQVSNFNADNARLLQGERRSEASDAVRNSFTDSDLLTDEIGEQHYLKRTAMKCLEVAELIGEFVNGNRGLVASPDFWIKGPPPSSAAAGTETPSSVIIGEAKSTHNLPLPTTADEVVRQYNDAFASLDASASQNPSEDQVRAWSHVGHPVSQLIGYLILNQCRFGLLTSATRTFFVYIDHQTSDNTDAVKISDAWFISQQGYLRALSTFYDLACKDGKPKLSRRDRHLWFRATPPRMKNARSAKRARQDEDPGLPHTRSRTQRGDGGGNDSAVDGTSSGLATSDLAKDDESTFPSDVGTIRQVDFEQIELKAPIGYGKRGTVFSAKWNNDLVAVKIFDGTKPDGQEAFDKEVAAYLHLQDAWGKLVPRPKFVSYAFGVCFLGMQMAHDPPDEACSGDWANVLDELEKKHRFRHLDVWAGERGDVWRNLMVIQDDEGVDHPIVIDLEDHEIRHECPWPRR